MPNCIHHDAMATHELLLSPPHDGAFDCDTEPLCTSCADDYPPERVRPITHTECSICERPIERTHPEHPLCAPCEGTATNSGGPYTPERHAAAWAFDRYGLGDPERG